MDRQNRIQKKENPVIRKKGTTLCFLLLKIIIILKHIIHRIDFQPINLRI